MTISKTRLTRLMLPFFVGIVLWNVMQMVHLMNFATPKTSDALIDLPVDAPAFKQNLQKQALPSTSALQNLTVRGGQAEENDRGKDRASIWGKSDNNPASKDSPAAAIQTQPRKSSRQSKTLGFVSGNDVNKTVINFPVCENDVCCASWEVDLDPWWQQNPLWRVSYENATHFCFSKLPSNSRSDMKRIAFLEALHQLQWYGNCSNVHARPQINSGLSASLNFLHKAFVTGWATNRPFQITLQKETFAWAYATYKNKTGVCATRDVRCYFLPVSNCQARIKQNDGDSRLHSHFTQELQGQWIREYFARPRQWLRLSLLKYRELS
jgi:hypothetical protein